MVIWPLFGLTSPFHRLLLDRNGVCSLLRDSFWNLLQEQFGSEVVLDGHPAERSSNTLNVSFVGRVGSEILA
jgi:cysteine desulfurase